jgi:hypothetical protein
MEYAPIDNGVEDRNFFRASNWIRKRLRVAAFENVLTSI